MTKLFSLAILFYSYFSFSQNIIPIKVIHLKNVSIKLLNGHTILLMVVKFMEIKENVLVKLFIIKTPFIISFIV